MRRHVDTETLAAFAEGLLPRRKAARVSGHVSHCPQCAQAKDQLADVTAVLADSPVPPMPATLTARIEAALAAEAAARNAALPRPAAGAQPAAAGGADADGTARPAARKAPRPVLRLRIVTAAAAVAVIVGGAVAVIQATGHSAPTSSAENASQHAGQVSGPLSSGAKPGSATSAGLPPLGAPVVASDTNYLPDRLASQVRAVLAQLRRRASAASGLRASTPVPALHGFAHLPACVRRIAGSHRPELVDLARYDGQPAAVIVVRTAGTPAPQVWVAGSNCSATTSDVLAHTTLPSSP